MNREAVIGFMKEHQNNCPNYSISRYIKSRQKCDFCQHVNRDTTMLMTRVRGARKTVDVGIALVPYCAVERYQPYSMAGFDVIYQKGKTEPERIRHVFTRAFNSGYQRVVLLSHSIPHLPLDFLDDALYILRNDKKMVLGPLQNGMFYLIGMTRHAYGNGLYSSIWNKIFFDDQSNRDMAMESLHGCLHDIALLPEWYLVKNIDDLRRFYQDNMRGHGWYAPWTRGIADKIFS
ncbi:MAG: DUF2064 domain-containing protein [Spirochaetota bacterium]